MKASVVALALLCASPVFAQTSTQASTQASSQASSREATHFENLATLLDLTDAQKPQVQAILQAEHAKMKAAFEQAKASGTKPDWQQMKTLHQQIQQETLQKLTPVLSATQMKKFQIIAQAMHGRGHFHGGPPASATPPAQN
jgi:ribulose bisphosphate carboxylase small subunit